MKNSLKISAIMIAAALLFVMIFAIGEKPTDPNQYGEGYTGELPSSDKLPFQDDTQSNEYTAPMWSQGENVALSATVKTDSVKSGEKIFAVDGDYATEWQSEKNKGAWISLEWDENKSVKTLTITWRHANVETLSIQVKDNSGNWIDVQFSLSRSYMAADHYYIDTYVFSDTLTVKGIKVSCDKIRTVNGKENGGLGIVELEAFGDAVYADRNTDFVIKDGILTSYKGNGGKVYIPVGTVGIAENALNKQTAEERSIQRLVLPDGMLYIGRNALSGCEGLESLSLPSTVRLIGQEALPSTTTLDEITVDENNPRFVSVDGVLYTRDMKTLVKYPAGRSDKNYVVPEGVEVIAYGAFQQAMRVEKVTLPESLRKIENYAFYKCSDLKDINIPEGVTEIKGFAFASCTDLLNVVVPQTVTEIGIGAFRDCTKLKAVEIKANITSVSNSMFNGCTKLESVILSNGITEIGASVFYKCQALKTVALPSNLKTIGETAFFESGLTEISIPNKTETIGIQAFRSCKELVTVSLPGSLQRVGISAFAGCVSLQKVTYPLGKDTLNSILDEGNNNLKLKYSGFNQSENLALTGTAFVNSTDDVYGALPECINDGNLETYWYSPVDQSKENIPWFYIGWSEAQKISTVIIRWGDGEPVLDEINVQVSNDTLNWNDVEFKSTTETDIDGKIMQIIVFEEQISVRNIKVIDFAKKDPTEVKGNPCVREVEVYSRMYFK